MARATRFRSPMNAPERLVSAESSSTSFLAGGGEMGGLMRAHQWARTSLGPPHNWPASLRTALRLLLNSGHPMYIWWGRELLCFYNDAYRCSIGADRHPSSLGRPGREVWAEIWPIIGPQIEHVMSGRGATWNRNHLVPITRNGRVEQVYWTYSYNPIDDESAPTGVGGVLVICTETTEQVLAEQAMRAAEARWRQLFDQAPGFMCVLSFAATTLAAAEFPRLNDAILLSRPNSRNCARSAFSPASASIVRCSSVRWQEELIR